MHLRQHAASVASLGLVSSGVETDGCHPIFFLKNLTTFLVIASSSLKVMTFFSCRLLTTPILPRHLSSVLSKFSHKTNNFRWDVTPCRVTPGAVPPSDATV